MTGSGTMAKWHSAVAPESGIRQCQPGIRVASNMKMINQTAAISIVFSEEHIE